MVLMFCTFYAMVKVSLRGPLDICIVVVELPMMWDHSNFSFIRKPHGGWSTYSVNLA